MLHTFPISSIPPIASWHPSNPTKTNRSEEVERTKLEDGMEAGCTSIFSSIRSVSCAMIKQTIGTIGHQSP